MKKLTIIFIVFSLSVQLFGQTEPEQAISSSGKFSEGTTISFLWTVGEDIVGITDTSKLCVISTGTYTGDDSVNRAIAHGLGVVPKFVKIAASGALSPIIQIIEMGVIHFMDAVNYNNLSVTNPTTTNFYIGNATDYENNTIYYKSI